MQPDRHYPTGYRGPPQRHFAVFILENIYEFLSPLSAGLVAVYLVVCNAREEKGVGRVCNSLLAISAMLLYQSIMKIIFFFSSSNFPVLVVHSTWVQWHSSIVRRV